MTNILHNNYCIVIIFVLSLYYKNRKIMKTLQSMTDFVLNNPTDFGMEVQSLTHQGNNRYNSHIRYAKFLTQKPNIGMFVPTNEYGNVLEKPQINNEFVTTLKPHELTEYQEAEQRVIFKGWDIEIHLGNSIFLEKGQDVICFTKRGKINYNGRNIQTIEDLVPFKLEIK